MFPFSETTLYYKDCRGETSILKWYKKCIRNWSEFRLSYYYYYLWKCYLLWLCCCYYVAYEHVIVLKDWRCNGKTYVAYRNYLSRPRNWERDSSRAPSLHSTPGNRLLFFLFLLELMSTYMLNFVSCNFMIWLIKGDKIRN